MDYSVIAAKGEKRLTPRPSAGRAIQRVTSENSITNSLKKC
jgi:hypothetical protein